jgi:hypothetical protein
MEFVGRGKSFEFLGKMQGFSFWIVGLFGLSVIWGESFWILSSIGE